MNALRKNLLSLLGTLPVLLAIALFLCAPVKYAACVRDGVSLWAVSVLPSIFPFLFLTAILTKTRLFSAFSRRASPVTQRLFKLSGACGSIFFLSVLSGYPVGARTLSDCARAGAIPREELFRAACLSSTSGPVFLVGVVGGAMLQRPALGWLMLLCHLLGVMLVCFFLSLGTKKAPTAAPPPLFRKSETLLYDSLYSAVISVLCVGGSIALFACFSQMACDLLPVGDGLGAAVLKGLFEMTSGCAALTKDPTPLSLALCCFFITFGGLCVLMQQLAYLTGAGVKAAPFMLVKLVQGLIAGGLCYLLSLLVL